MNEDISKYLFIGYAIELGIPAVDKWVFIANMGSIVYIDGEKVEDKPLFNLYGMFSGFTVWANIELGEVRNITCCGFSTRKETK